MNKVLHVLVYVFLLLAAGALYIELQLNAKRDELTDRNRLQEDCLVKLARTIEKADPDKSATFEIKKDASPVEAKLVDSPDTENVLQDYPAPLEQANLETHNFENSRQQLRSVYVLDADGKPVMDGSEKMKRGPGTEQELLDKLFDSAKTQQSRLNSTRAALADLRGKLEATVQELNKLKPEARQDKVTIEEQKTKLAKLEEDKAALENKVTKIKSQIGELNGEITSLKDEVQTAKDETTAAKDETAKAQKLIAQLKDLLKQSVQTSGTQSSGSAVATAQFTAGDKGKIVQVDNDTMFAIIKLNPDAYKELKLDTPNAALPIVELGIKRPGFKGPAGEFVGRVRTRQAVKGKPYVICDVLSSWEQDKAKVNDVLFAD